MEIPVSVSVLHFPETNLEVFSVFLSIEIKQREKRVVTRDCKLTGVSAFCPSNDTGRPHSTQRFSISEIVKIII
jgi:hypothetical protein